MKSKKRILVILAGGASSRLKKSLNDVDLDKNVSDLAKSSHKTLIPLGKDKRPLIYFILKNAINAGVVCGSGVNKPNINEITDLKLIYDKEKIDGWTNKKWPHDMLSEIEWFVLEQAKRNNILKKGNLILTGAYGPPIPINDKKLIEVTSSLFGNVSAVFK